MFTKTRLALAATLILGSATVALADEAGVYDNRDAQAVQQQTLTTRPVALPQSHAVSPAAERWMDRASQVFDGGR
jgi:hypothetical protein